MGGEFDPSARTRISTSTLTSVTETLYCKFYCVVRSVSVLNKWGLVQTHGFRHTVGNYATIIWSKPENNLSLRVSVS